MNAPVAKPVAPPERFDVAAIRAQFPILERTVHDHRLVYLDNAATTQKPQPVIDALVEYYSAYNSNVHRGVHALSELATRRIEAARTTVARFLNAADEREIVFTRGTTEAINLVAAGFREAVLGPGDEVLVTHMEHHSNIVPWQLACERSGATLRVVPVHDDGSLDLEAFADLLSDRTKLVAVVHVSNSLGTINPVRAIIDEAHARGVPVLVDGAQAVSHMPVDVQALDADFYAFSGHKVYGPTGIGALYGKAAWLEQLPPYQGGGDMIRSVRFDGTIYADIPSKFEAGTPNIADAIALATALDWLEQVDRGALYAYEAELLSYGTELLGQIDGLHLVGTAPQKAAVLAFDLEGIHPHDVGTVLDREGIAVRAGHHCTQPLMERLGLTATARASLAAYNTFDELDALQNGIRKTIELFR